LYGGKTDEEDMAVNFKKKIDSFPNESGVYLFRDKRKKIIYIGKAANLKQRLTAYLSKGILPYKTQAMIKEAANVEYITTPTEQEAFLLESRLIKKHQPPFNISLKDDKSFPFIKITKDDFPRVIIGRKKINENVEYVGPYTNAKLLRIAIRALREVFPFCNCRIFPKKACLNYHIGLCAGPCIKKISKPDYCKMINELKYFLRNTRHDLIKNLIKKMQNLSKQHKYEQAMQIRDRISALNLLANKTRATIASVLGLKKEPRRIEAFDISNLFGKEAVGSMVTFIDGKPSKKDYRRFRIRKVENIDDYQMLTEVLERRYRRVIRENLERPDLIVIDGGRGHLKVACRLLQSLGIDITVIAIAKQEELIYTVSDNIPLRLEKDNKALRLIQHIRDESHRFAVKYHRLLRRKKKFNLMSLKDKSKDKIYSTKEENERFKE